MNNPIVHYKCSPYSLEYVKKTLGINPMVRKCDNCNPRVVCLRSQQT